MAEVVAEHVRRKLREHAKTRKFKVAVHTLSNKNFSVVVADERGGRYSQVGQAELFDYESPKNDLTELVKLGHTKVPAEKLDEIWSSLLGSAARYLDNESATAKKWAWDDWVFLLLQIAVIGVPLLAIVLLILWLRSL